jgi:hypothetical protein
LNPLILIAQKEVRCLEAELLIYGNKPALEGKNNMDRRLKFAIFAVLLIGASYFFGIVCEQSAQVFQLLLVPSNEILMFLIKFLLALGAMLVCAGLVAALIRPLWVASLAFGLSGLTIIFAWEVTVVSGTLTLLYFLISVIYTRNVIKRLDQQLEFSVRAISLSQKMLISVLILVVCGSIYLGASSYVKQEGFSIPEKYIEMIMKAMEPQIVSRTAEEGREVAILNFRKEFREIIDGFFDETVGPYERFIPLGLSFSLFMTLVTITGLLSWIPTLILETFFSVLLKLGVVKVVTETLEVRRLVIN